MVAIAAIDPGETFSSPSAAAFLASETKPKCLGRPLACFQALAIGHKAPTRKKRAYGLPIDTPGGTPAPKSSIGAPRSRSRIQSAPRGAVLLDTVKASGGRTVCLISLFVAEMSLRRKVL